MWAEGQNIGNKVSLENVQQNENSSIDPEVIKNNYMSLTSNNYKISCKKLINKLEIFLPPSDINFQ